MILALLLVFFLMNAIRLEMLIWRCASRCSSAAKYKSKLVAIQSAVYTTTTAAAASYQCTYKVHIYESGWCKLQTHSHTHTRVYIFKTEWKEISSSRLISRAKRNTGFLCAINTYIYIILYVVYNKIFENIMVVVLTVVGWCCIG